MNKIFSKLQFRLIVLIILSVLPALGLLIYSTNEQRQMAASHAREDSIRILQTVSNNYEQLINETHQFLITLSQAAEVQSGNQDGLQRLFSNLLKDNPLYTNIILVAPDGSLIQSAIPPNAPFNLSNYTDFQLALEKKDFVIGEYQFGEISRKTIIPFSYPVLDKNGEVQAVLSVAMDLAWLNRLAVESKLSPGTSLTLVGRKGTVLYRYPDADKWVGKKPETPVIKNILSQKGEGTYEGTGMDGTQRLYVFKSLQKTATGEEIYIYSGIPEDVVYAGTNQQLTRNITLIGITTLLIIVIGWIAGNRFFLRQIKTLIDVTKLLSSGKLDARTGLSNLQGELGELGFALDEMANNLEQRTNELRRAESKYRILVRALKRYQLLSEHANDIVLFVRFTDGRIIEANRAAVKAYGYSWEELLAKTIFDLRISDIPIIEQQMHCADSTGIIFETEHRKKDGSVFPVEVSSQGAYIGDERVLLSIIRDITERKQAEQALYESENKYRAIFETTGSATAIVEENGTLSLANTEFEKLSSYTKEEIENKKNWKDFVSTGDALKIEQYRQLRFNDPNLAPRNYELQFVNKHGVIYDAYATTSLISGTKQVIWSILDITKLKQNEEELKKAEQEKDLILHGISEVVLYYDTELRIVWANTAALNFTGLELNQLVGLNCYEIFYQRSEPCEVCLFKKVFETGRPQDGEISIINGRALFVRGYPVRDADAKIAGIVSIMLDMTEHNRAEEALRASEEKYRNLFNNANDAIFLVDFSEDRILGKIIEANDVACHRLGYSREELLTKTAMDLNPNEKINDLKRFARELYEKGFEIIDTKHITKSGLQIPVEVSAHIFTLSGKKVVLAVVRDITERKKAEEELMEARVKAERSERLASLGTLAAGIAHEINQPLNSLKIIVDGMLYFYKITGVLDMQEVIGELKKVSSQADRIDNIIKHMQSLIRNEQNTQLSLCSINDAVEGALSLIGTQLLNHKINLVKSLPSDISCVLGDNRRLEEVVINLVINAMHALDEINKPDKEILIKTGLEYNKVILEISDNAYGIDETIKDKIFEPFFTTKEVGMGMGLGLPIVHSIVSSYNGKIEAKLNEKGGATFRVELPDAKSKASEI